MMVIFGTGLGIPITLENGRGISPNLLQAACGGSFLEEAFIRKGSPSVLLGYCVSRFFTPILHAMGQVDGSRISAGKLPCGSIPGECNEDRPKI